MAPFKTHWRQIRAERHYIVPCSRDDLPATQSLELRALRRRAPVQHTPHVSGPARGTVSRQRPQGPIFHDAGSSSAGHLARRFVEDTKASRGSHVAQWYGYAVCLIAVITFLVTINTLVDNVFALADPIRAGGNYEPTLTSFEAYQATLDRRAPATRADSLTPKMTDAEVRRHYEVLRADRIAQRRFEATKSLATSAILMVLAIALFSWHWAWLRRTVRGVSERPGAVA